MIIPENNVAPILIVHTGGLGDLVLASRLVEGLTRRFPNKRIVILVRQPFLQLPTILPAPPHEVLALDFEPHQETVPTEALRLKLKKLAAVVRGLQPAMVIAADLEPSWLSWFLISILPDSRACGCTESTPPHGLLSLLIREFGGEPRSLESPVLTGEAHENDRYTAILHHLGCKPSEITPWPKPLVDAELFGAIGVEPGKYIACFPTGASSTLVKRWSPAQYAAVLSGRLNENSKLLLTGEESERPALEQFKEAFGVDAGHIRIFTGSADDIGKLRMLLAHARLYFGNDTGPAHLAQAYAVPGVVVFGGGTWPHYAPWGQGSVGVVQPMGCFGCRWDCAFGQPYCLGTLPLDPVLQAFDRASGPPAPASVIEVQELAERRYLFKAAAETYHRIQRERRDRAAAAMELHGDLLIPLQPIEQEDQYLAQLRQLLARQMKALQLVDAALRSFLPAAGVSVNGHDDLESAPRRKAIRGRQAASDTELLRGQLDLQEQSAQVKILSEGLAEARRQLEAAGAREQHHLAELSKYRRGSLKNYLRRWWNAKG